MGLALLAWVIQAPERAAVARLADVPEIERLIAEAESQQARVALLQEQRRNLDVAVRIEARRLAFEARRNALENEAARVLSDLEALDADLAAIEAADETPAVRDEVSALERRLSARQRGAQVIRICWP